MPSSLLNPNTTYWYGVLENTIQFENGEALTAATASFTTTAEAIEMVIYEDFDDRRNFSLFTKYSSLYCSTDSSRFFIGFIL